METKINLITSDPTNVQMLEKSEINYWSALYKTNQSNEVGFKMKNQLFLGWMKPFDILAFNRCLGMGFEKHSVNGATVELIIHENKVQQIPRFFVQLSPLAPYYPEARSLLSAHGFQHYNNWVKLARPVKDPVPEVESTLVVTPVRKPEADVFGKILASAFDWPDHLCKIFANTVGYPGYFHFFARDKGEPVAAAALFVEGTIASMAIAGTLPQARGKGAQNLLLAHRVSIAQRLGCQIIVSETGEEQPGKPVQSFRNMQKLGFEIVYKRPNYLFVNNY